MPFFLFIVGMAMALSLKKITNRTEAVRKVILRTIKLFFWRILLQANCSGIFGSGIDRNIFKKASKGSSPTWQVLNIQVILLVLTAIPTISLILICKLIGACVLVLYLALVYGTYVPVWYFTVLNVNSPDYGKVMKVTCGVREKLDPSCNAVGYIGRRVLGINHMYQRLAWKRLKACTENSPYEGPFLKDAPSWCWASFEPEGIMRFVVPHI